MATFLKKNLDRDLDQINRFEELKRLSHINQTGLICHATYFNGIPYLLERGLTVRHPERQGSILPDGINVTLIGYLIGQLDAPFPAIAGFNLEQGSGVVFLGGPANQHVPEQYRQFASDERPVFSLFEIPDDVKIRFQSAGTQVEMTGLDIKNSHYSERNENMTGMIISRPDIPRNWLRGFVIAPSCYIHPHTQNRESVQSRTLDFIDIDDPRVKRVENSFGQSYLAPQEVLCEAVIRLMHERVSMKNHCEIFDIKGNLLYRPTLF